eukprot:7021657-Pyramimonas_sp.AAC.1
MNRVDQIIGDFEGTPVVYARFIGPLRLRAQWILQRAPPRIDALALGAEHAHPRHQPLAAFAEHAPLH